MFYFKKRFITENKIKNLNFISKFKQATKTYFKAYFKEKRFTTQIVKHTLRGRCL